MAQISFIPLRSKHLAGDQNTRAASGTTASDPPEVDETSAAATALGLWASKSGGLRAAPLGPAQGDAAGCTEGEELIAVLKCRDEDGTPAWYAASRSNRFGVNGEAPLPLVRLDLGSLISLGRDFWFLARLWRPEPKAAPPELADTACPICGDKLSAAPVVECPDPSCGRYVHLERPEEPESQDALNCFLLADKCGGCGHPTTLEPVIVPQPDEKLLPFEAEIDPVDADDGV